MWNFPHKHKIAGNLATVAAFLLLAACQSERLKLTDQGKKEYQAGDYPAAEHTFDRVLDKDQSNAEANYYAGMAAFQQGKYGVAEYHLKLAWQFNPSLGEVKDALTETIIRNGGSADQALDFLERDAELTAKTREHSTDKANGKRPYRYQTEDAMFLNKANDRLRVAKVYEKIGDLDNAAVNYEIARKMAPDSPSILLAIGEFYARVGQKDKAAKAFEHAYNLNPKYPGLVDAISRNDMVISK